MVSRRPNHAFACQQCGTSCSVYQRPSDEPRRFCGKSCAMKAQRAADGIRPPSQWKGDTVSKRGGRTRALRRYPGRARCERCGKPGAERHHRNGNTADNEPSNIIRLCRRCHMAEDGRLAAVQAQPGRGIV